MGEGASLNIGQFCSIAFDVRFFLGGNHRIDWITTFPFGTVYVPELGGSDIVGHPSTNGGITVGNDVWIGTGSEIMSGIRIGNGAVIAANSQVVKDVGDYEIVGGNPAKSIAFRFNEEIRGLLLQLRWWDLPVEVIRTITHQLSSAPTPSLLTELIRQFRPTA
jgi:acetyltransferase-like isoleucine patch superfamily enzyme